MTGIERGVRRGVPLRVLHGVDAGAVEQVSDKGQLALRRLVEQARRDVVVVVAVRGVGVAGAGIEHLVRRCVTAFAVERVVEEGAVDEDADRAAAGAGRLACCLRGSLEAPAHALRDVVPVAVVGVGGVARGDREDAGRVVGEVVEADQPLAADTVTL